MVLPFLLENWKDIYSASLASYSAVKGSAAGNFENYNWEQMTWWDIHSQEFPQQYDSKHFSDEMKGSHDLHHFLFL